MSFLSSSSIVIGNEYYDLSFIPLKGEHQQLFLRQGTGLQGGVVFKEKMTIRPAVSNPLSRKSRTLVGPATASGIKADDKSRRTNYMTDVVSEDPEKKRQKQMKQEEERLKATIKKESAQRRIRERHHKYAYPWNDYRDSVKKMLRFFHFTHISPSPFITITRVAANYQLATTLCYFPVTSGFCVLFNQSIDRSIRF